MLEQIRRANVKTEDNENIQEFSKSIKKEGVAFFNKK